MLIADSGNTEYQLGFLVAEVNAVRILQHCDCSLLNGALSLCGTMGDCDTHTHVCADKLFSLKHSVYISRLYAASLHQELAGSSDRLFLCYGRLAELDALADKDILLNCLSRLSFVCCCRSFCRSIQGSQLQIEGIQSRIIQEVADCYKLCLRSGFSRTIL